MAALLGLALSVPALHAGATKAHDVAGKYKGRAAQGMAIYGDLAFLLNDGGHCRVYDLAAKKLVREFDLASAGDHNHANCASFGVEFPKGNTRFPAFYIAQCRHDYSCYVESIGEHGSELVQTLTLKTGTRAGYGYDWIVDTEQKCLYVLANAARNIDGRGTNQILITKLPLPPLTERNVLFTGKDIIEQFELTFPSVTQGAAIRGGLLYMPVGLHETSKNPSPRAKSHEIIVVNLKTKKIEKTIDVNHVKEEPEDAAFHGDTLLMYVGQSGGLYKINGL